MARELSGSVDESQELAAYPLEWCSKFPHGRIMEGAVQYGSKSWSLGSWPESSETISRDYLPPQPPAPILLRHWQRNVAGKIL